MINYVQIPQDRFSEIGTLLLLLFENLGGFSKKQLTAVSECIQFCSKLGCKTASRMKIFVRVCRVRSQSCARTLITAGVIKFACCLEETRYSPYRARCNRKRLDYNLFEMPRKIENFV